MMTYNDLVGAGGKYLVINWEDFNDTMLRIYGKNPRKNPYIDTLEALPEICYKDYSILIDLETNTVIDKNGRPIKENGYYGDKFSDLLSAKVIDSDGKTVLSSGKKYNGKYEYVPTWVPKPEVQLDSDDYFGLDLRNGVIQNPQY